MAEDRYAVACRTPWFWDLWRDRELPGEWLDIREEDGLVPGRLEQFSPRYIFFPHWSKQVPDAIYGAFECVCFHAAPVPYGRGGSPIQNMIVRGHEETEVVALRMVEELDAGPVYRRERMSLLGGGDELYLRIASLVLDMMEEIVENEPEPREQEGELVIFRRRRPEESEIGEGPTLAELFDFIRMLDAEGYPSAFLRHGGMRFEFSRPALRRGEIEASVRITPVEDASEGRDGTGEDAAEP